MGEPQSKSTKYVNTVKCLDIFVAIKPYDSFCISQKSWRVVPNGQQEQLHVCLSYSSCELQLELIQHLWLVICIPYPEFVFHKYLLTISVLSCSNGHRNQFYLKYLNFYLFLFFFPGFMWSDLGEDKGKDGMKDSMVGVPCRRVDWFLTAWKLFFWSH